MFKCLTKIELTIALLPTKSKIKVIFAIKSSKNKSP